MSPSLRGRRLKENWKGIVVAQSQSLPLALLSRLSRDLNLPCETSLAARSKQRRAVFAGYSNICYLIFFGLLTNQLTARDQTGQVLK